MSQIVEWPEPLLPGMVDLLFERDCSLFFTHVQEEGILDEADGLLVKLIEIRDKHEDEQIDEDVGILANL